MKRALVVVVLSVGCGREPAQTTATIAPAEPRPAPTVTATILERPLLTTSGSPPPASAVTSGSETVTIDAAGLSVRPLLPRGHTAFRVRNQTAAAHDLVLTGGPDVAEATIPARGTVVLQMLLRAETYELACVIPGHTERAGFRTYVPGTRLEIPPVRDGIP